MFFNQTLPVPQFGLFCHVRLEQVKLELLGSFGDLNPSSTITGSFWATYVHISSHQQPPVSPPRWDLSPAPSITDPSDGWAETSITSFWFWEDDKESKSILASGSDWSYWCWWKHSGLWNMLKCLLFCSVSCLYFDLMFDYSDVMEPIIPITH